jgi:hypothetical protein
VALWVALAVLLVGVAAGLGVAVYRGVCLWRLTKRTTRAFGAELDRISRVTAEIDDQLRRADESAKRLGASRERLEASRAKLEVQLAAVREARAQLARTFWFVPGVG